MMKRLSFLFILFLVFPACKTKSELRREQEFEKMQSALKEARGDRADVESLMEENRQELTRIGNVMEAEAQARRREADEFRKEISTLSTRIQALEQRVVAEELAAKQPPPQPEKPKATYEYGKKLYDEGQYNEAAEVLRAVAKVNPRSEEGKRAHFLMAESLFASRDFASAALEFGEFRKNFPKDTLLPNAIYRQAQAFQSMGKRQEAKLFFQDLIDRYPKSSVTAKAKGEIRKLK